MSSGFLIWGGAYREGFCVVNRPEGFEKQGLLLKGVPVAGEWPDDVKCRMDPDHPKDIKLADNVYAGSHRVVSSRLKDALTSLVSNSNIEFLPISILNHKGRLASRDYFIVNPLDTIDCIDQEQSGVKWNKINTGAISSCSKLVLKDDSIPADSAVFRPKFMLKAILVRRTITAELLAAGMTGLFFLEPSNYNG